MFLLVPAHLGCPGQSPESCKVVVVVVVIAFLVNFCPSLSAFSYLILLCG